MFLFRKRLIPLVILVTLAILPFSLLRSQGSVNSPYIPSIIPPSPNAASLMKFSDVPVSPYTGTADITVPIYTILARGITIPVSLSYHTAGIKLEEEASWVGLGWALNAGGMISRTIMGHDDFGTQGDVYFSTQCPQLSGDISSTQPLPDTLLIGPYIFDFTCSYQVNTSVGTEDFTNAFATSGDVYDMEPDIFSYNFAGHSGKFILTRTGKVVMQKQENIKIQFQGSGSQVTFSITDDQGNNFYFNVLEQTALSPKPPQISSWLLSKVVTQQQDSILFNYASGGTTVSSNPDNYLTYINYCPNVDGTFTSTSIIPAYYNQTLQSIDFNNGHIQFASDANRTDLTGGYKLDSIMVYSKNAAGTQTFLKQENFYYTYFNGNWNPSNVAEYFRLKLDSVKEISGSFSLPPYSFTYNNPNPGIYTAKHGYSIDHWGYYNGASNSSLIPTMTAYYNPINNETGFAQYLSYLGGNRQPDFTSMQTFSLQQVTYPTGGKTALTYQANDYDYYNSNQSGPGTDPFQFFQLVSMDTLFNATGHGTTSGTIDLTRIYPIIPGGSPQTNLTIIVAFRYLKNDTFPYSNPGGKIYFNLGGTDMDIHAATCSNNVCSLTASVALGSGVFPWTAYIDASIDTISTFAGIYVTIQYQETQQSYNQFYNNSYILPSAGLRIQSVTNYKDPSTIATKKVYSYTYLQDKQGTGRPQQYSYGRLMSMPVYGRYGITNTNLGGYCRALFLFGSSFTSSTSAIQGNIVGYDQVTEYSIDPLTGQDIGKTVYTYFNSPDTAVQYDGYRLPGLLNMGNNLNGLLLSKVDYADNGGIYTKVDESDNYYHTTNRTVYYSPKYQYSGPYSTGTCQFGSPVETQTIAWFYPSIKSEKVLLDSSWQTLYQQGDSTKYVVIKKYNYYDNPVHYQLTRSSTIDSKGDTLLTKISYPQDYIPNGNMQTGNTILDSMIGRNMVSETIEKQDSLYYPGNPAGFVTGAQVSLYRILTGNGNTIVPDKTYKLDLQAPANNFQPFAISGNSTSMDSRYRQMISFDAYDPNNNIQQYTSTDQNPVTIIWDYNHIYPIAQAKNAAVADVAASSFEADGTGNWTYTGSSTLDTSSITGNYSYNLGQTGGSITKSGLTSGNTYILSYWTKNLTPLSIAGTMSGYPIQGKTIRGWTYFEHKLTGQTSITVGGSGYIDELRLYPATAQMTTYTYSPLAGMTSGCDVDNKVTYYFFDGFQRLIRIKDQDGNIVKTIQYHYQGQ